MTRKGKAITLSIDDRDKAALETLAAEYGCTWGEKPNISKLVKAIARHELRLARNTDWQPERLTALERSRRQLIDLGQIDDALAIAQLLLERRELNLLLRQEIERFVARPTPAWRQELDRYIQRQQPFSLAYQDAAERLWQFTVRHAAIVHHEDRQYLDCWCDETAGNQDLPELQHNWSLRLDRIPAETAIAPTPGPWRDSLASLSAELHFFGGLAFAYRTKSDADLSNEWHPEQPRVRRVVRRVANSFWFFREIRRYGADCELVAPSGLRDRFCQQQRQICARYGLSV
ncbi:MAG: WYL domain-containing protein [Spirulinaceae cyanobacterium RM2_2_10]|nr:WYL domain-containing protein [Spirulinaceae cyanobacterium SM2_1_0]NJO19882.1 WYL domain-containing protein [Spirulinaceae cyanobacterium RM2_2_10]